MKTKTDFERYLNDTVPIKTMYSAYPNDKIMRTRRARSGSWLRHNHLVEFNKLYEKWIEGGSICLNL